MEQNTVERRGFLQRMLCLMGGAAGASALQPNATATENLPVEAPPAGSAVRFLLRCHHQHGAGQKAARMVCRGEIFEKPGSEPVGEFYSNCFHAESSFGVANPFSASNIELHTIRLRNGTLFGMGANHVQGEAEKAHAILGGTGGFAGARGTYTIKNGEVDHQAVELTLSLLS